MATVESWTPFGVAFDITANSSGVTRTSAGQFQVSIGASWKVHWSGAQTNYGMSASSGGGSAELNRFGAYASSGNGSFTGTYGISGYGSQNKTITVTFRNFNNDNGRSATQNVSFNVTVPAWTSYTVSYNANGGTGAPANQTKWKDENLTLSSIKPTRTGYTFQGWSTSTDSTVEYNPGSKYTSNSSVTLYAVWKINTYTVTFVNGLGTTLKTQKVDYGKNATPPANPTRTGYTFAGWSGSYTNVTSNRTITATWTINKYYIDVNGSLDGSDTSGTSPMGTFDMYINNSLAMNDATDYYQQQNYQTSYKVQDIKANTGYNYTGATGSLSGTVPAGNVSVRLNFTTKKYTVSFNANLGEAVSNMPSSFTKTHFASVKLPTNVPTSRRYEFLGWSTSANGVVKYKPGDTYSAEGNATLYAIWKLRASVLNVYDSSRNRRNGLLHIYNDDGELHYGIMFVYGSDGRPHEVV